MTLSSRREFVWQGLSALTTYALLRTLAVNELLASPIRPSLSSWISGLNEICGDMRRDSLSLDEALEAYGNRSHHEEGSAKP